jgi:hypothetical protein
MSMAELLDLALRLPEEERAELAHHLLRSLTPPGQEPSSEQEWEQAWMEEVRRRVERFDGGETTARDAREALAEIQARLKRKTPS